MRTTRFWNNLHRVRSKSKHCKTKKIISCFSKNTKESKQDSQNRPRPPISEGEKSYTLFTNIASVITTAKLSLFIKSKWFHKNDILLCVFTCWVPCCDVSYDFRIETMFGSSLPPVVCRRAHVLFTLCLLASV